MNRLKLTKVELLFENSSYVRIPVKFMKSLYLGNISENIAFPYRHTVTEFPYDLRLSKTAEMVRLVLSKKVLSLDVMFSKEIKEEIPLFDKLKEHRDITAITLFYQDYGKPKDSRDTKITYGVVWNQDNDCANSFQTVEQGRDGDVIVEISKP